MKRHSQSYVREITFKYMFRLDWSKPEEIGPMVKQELENFDALYGEFEDTYQKSDEEHMDNKYNNAIKKEAVRYIQGIFNNIDALYTKLNDNLTRRDFKTISRSEASILLVTGYELMYEETPSQVVINEAIELAKKFSIKEAKGLINAVLDKLAK